MIPIFLLHSKRSMANKCNKELSLMFKKNPTTYIYYNSPRNIAELFLQWTYSWNTAMHFKYGEIILKRVIIWNSYFGTERLALFNLRLQDLEFKTCICGLTFSAKYNAFSL